MVKIDFWVEGIADQKFLSDIMQYWHKLPMNWNKRDALFECRDDERKITVKIRKSNGVGVFTSADGWQKVKPLFKDNIDNEIKNVVILDADYDYHSRMNEVRTTVENFDVSNDLFLWPENKPDAEKGDLERLLERIINSNNQDVFTCWQNYENCLTNAVGKNYTTPARKTKIYAYLEALLGETNQEKEKIKERERDYTNSLHWNLDLHHKNEPLNPLFLFLGKYF